MTRTEYEEGKRLLAAHLAREQSACYDLRDWLLTHRVALLDAVKPEPMKRGATSAETCRLNGWEVGDVLVGVEFGLTARIKITALGLEKLLAARITAMGLSHESLWTLESREWHREEA